MMATLTYKQYKLRAPAAYVRIVSKYGAPPQAKPPITTMDKILGNGD